MRRVNVVMMLLFLVVAGIFALTSCSTLSGIIGGSDSQLTPEQRYIEARVLFNSVYKTYLDTYDTMPGTVQAKWKERIDPRMKDASAALGAWKVVLAGEEIGDPATKEAAYRFLKNKALALLFEYEILKIEE